MAEQEQGQGEGERSQFQSGCRCQQPLWPRQGDDSLERGKGRTSLKRSWTSLPADRERGKTNYSRGKKKHGAIRKNEKKGDLESPKAAGFGIEGGLTVFLGERGTGFLSKKKGGPRLERGSRVGFSRGDDLFFAEEGKG